MLGPQRCYAAIALCFITFIHATNGWSPQIQPSTRCRRCERSSWNKRRILLVGGREVRRKSPGCPTRLHGVLSRASILKHKSNKNPLPYLASNKFESWDMVFQDDGSRPWRYAPYSPNTGFYFVRNTPLTRHLVETLLRSGDTIQVARSHQHVMNDILVEFSTSKGLRAKVVHKGENNPFLGGVEFHNQHEVMHSLLNGTSDAYVFHMSWTHNKENKIKFLQQLGEWYWSDEEQSCLARPEITCHYRDKPSKVPCVSSPRIDGDQTKNVSFW